MRTIDGKQITPQGDPRLYFGGVESAAQLARQRAAESRGDARRALEKFADEVEDWLQTERASL